MDQPLFLFVMEKAKNEKIYRAYNYVFIGTKGAVYNIADIAIS